MNNKMMVYKENETLLTNSLIVAEVFGKEHYNVLRDISNLECSEQFNALNFGLVDYTDAKGEKRPMYTITRDGCVFLIMGFTGEKAAKFKEAYINEFSRMEKALTCPDMKSLLSANRCSMIAQKTQIELLRDWLEVYTKPLGKREPALSVDDLHRMVNGWLITNRYSRISKRDLRVYMGILKYQEQKIHGFTSYGLSVRQEFRR